MSLTAVDILLQPSPMLGVCVCVCVCVYGTNVRFFSSTLRQLFKGKNLFWLPSLHSVNTLIFSAIPKSILNLALVQFIPESLLIRFHSSIKHVAYITYLKPDNMTFPVN